MQFYDEAQHAFELHNYQQTITILTAAITSDSTHYPSYILRGQAHQRLQNYKEAITDFTKVVGMDSHYAEAYRNRGEVNQIIGKYHDALVDYSIAVELEKKSPLSYLGRANVNNKLKLYDQAESDYSQAIKLDPSLIKAYMGRAEVHEKQGNYQASIDDYTQALKIDSLSDDCLSQRATVYQKLGQFKKSLEDYNKAIELSDRNVQYYYRRGLTHFKLNNYKETLEDCQKCMQLAPKHAMALNLRGMVQQYQGNYNEAVGDYNKAIRNAPEQAFLWNNRGLYNLKMKNYKCYKASETDFQTALNLSPNNPAYLFNLAACKLQMSENNKAYQYLEHGIQCCLSENEDTLVKHFNMCKNHLADLKKQLQEYNELLLRIDEAGESGQLQEDNEVILTIDELRQELKQMMIKRLTNIQNDFNSKRHEQHNEQMQDFEGRLYSVELMVSKDLRSSSKLTSFRQQVKRQIRKLSKNIQYYSMLDDKIKTIVDKTLRDYYYCLTNVLFNHLTAYRLINHLFHDNNINSTLSAQSIVFYQISQTQPIYHSFPSFGVLVQTPFQIIQSLLYKTAHVLIKDVAQKIGLSHLNTNKAMAEVIMRTITSLIKNNKFNQTLLQNLKDQNAAYLTQLWERISSGPVSDKLLKSILGKFEYEEQVVVAHLTLITKAFDQLEYNDFVQITKVEQSFVELISGCLWPKIQSLVFQKSKQGEGDNTIKEFSTLTTISQLFEQKNECQIM